MMCPAWMSLNTDMTFFQKKNLHGEVAHLHTSGDLYYVQAKMASSLAYTVALTYSHNPGAISDDRASMSLTR